MRDKDISTTGPLSHTLLIQDAQSGRPITNYIAHAIVRSIQTSCSLAQSLTQLRKMSRQTDLQTSSSLPQDPEDEWYIGALEDKQVSDPRGQCRYEKLPPMEARFVVCARGYLPEMADASIRTDGGMTVIKLARAGEVSGRVVKAATGQPIGGLSLEIVREEDNRSSPSAAKLDPSRPPEPAFKQLRTPGGLPLFSSYDTKTDANGRFVLPCLHPGRYKFELDDRIEAIVYVRRDAGEKLRRGPDHLLTLSLPEIEHKIDDAMTSGSWAWLCPTLEPIQVEADRKIDLGAIALRHIPTLELTLTKKGERRPPAYFPFELELLEGGKSKQLTGSIQTDANGRARIPLIGFEPGMKLAIYLPAKMAKRYHLDGPELDESQVGRLHPNAQIVEPKPDETARVRMAYKPQPGDLDLRLRFRNKTSGAVVRGVKGLIAEQADHCWGWLYADHILQEWTYIYYLQPCELAEFNWPLQEAGGNKSVFRALNLTLSEAKQQAEREKKPEGENLYLFASAPGYLSQAFTFPLARARAGKELTFDLAPEAIVRGRMVCADTGEPLTSATLRAMVQRAGRLDAHRNEVGKQWGEDFSISRLLLKSRRPNRLADEIARRETVASTRDAQLAPDGRFEFRSVNPEDDWALSIIAIALHDNERPIKRLSPGVNDLGDIPVDLSAVR